MEPTRAFKGRLWPGIWHPWPPFGRLLEGNLAAKRASKIKKNSRRKFVTKIIENSSPGLRKSGPFLVLKNRVPAVVFGPDAPGRPRASPGVPKAVPGLPLGAPWASIGPPWSVGPSWAHFGTIFGSLGDPSRPLGLPNATICDPCSPPRRRKKTSHDN